MQDKQEPDSKSQTLIEKKEDLPAVTKPLSPILKQGFTSENIRNGSFHSFLAQPKSREEKKEEVEETPGEKARQVKELYERF